MYTPALLLTSAIFTAPASARVAVAKAALDSQTSVTRLGQIEAAPGLRLIDANGQIVKTKRNYFTEADVTDFVAAYRAEVAKSSAPAPAS